MSECSSNVDLVNRALLDLLCSLPTAWQDHDPAGMSATEEQALRLLERAGLVERRAEVRVAMAGRGEAVEMTVVVSGENSTRLIWERLFAAVPEWLDENGRTGGRTRMS